ncbi:MAG: hypothetical protein K2I77_06270, partial [Anaeroplasmataceae bacterium]|nr:hypothetical protein [Anaeroplasmataceae bacterium]
DNRIYVSLDEKIYLNNNLFLVSGLNNLEELNQSLSSNELEVTETITLSFNSSYTDVINSKGVIYRYYFNTDGEVTSQFEVDKNSLRTLYQETGYCAMKNMEKWYSGFTINQKRTVSRNIGVPIDCLDKNLDEEDFKERNYEVYRENKFYDYIHFKVGFFVKHNCTNATYMKAIFYYKDIASKEEKIAIDYKATDAWQYVEIPFSRANDYQAKSYGLSQGRIRIVSDGTGTYEVSDVRFYEIERSFIYLNNAEKTTPIKNYYSINLELANGTKQKLLMDEQYFLSDSDLALDWLYKERENDGKFDFVCCNGKKRYRVKNVSFQDKYSDEGSLSSHIFPFKNITFQTKDVLDNVITDSFPIYCDGTIITTTNIMVGDYSYTQEERDLQGRVLYSVDFYGKQTVNEYDDYGNLLSTIIAKKDDFESNGKISEGKKCLYLLYSYAEEKEELRENLSSIKNEESSIEFSYDDSAINQCNSIQTNDNIKTNYVYDCINRFSEICEEDQKNHISYNPLGSIGLYSDNSSYEYEIRNNATNSTIAIKSKKSTAKQKLSDTTIYYESNFLNQSYPMLGTYLLTLYNKYGKTTKYNYAAERKVVNITYQEIGDKLSSDGLTNYFDGSLSAASIKQIKCPFTGNTYDFNYNNANLLKEYIMRNEDTVLLSVSKEAELSTKYNVGGKEYVTAKEFNNNPVQNRIIKTKNGESSDSDFSKFTYSYEYHPVLGTITKKTGENSSREISYENQDNSSYYSSNPQKITQKYGNKSFDITYNYNQSNDIIKVFG